MFDHLLETVDPMDFFKDEEELALEEKKRKEKMFSPAAGGVVENTEMTSIQANGTMPVRTLRRWLILVWTDMRSIFCGFWPFAIPQPFR